MTDDTKALLQRLRHYGDNDRDAACTLIEQQAADLKVRQQRQHDAEHLAGEYLMQRDDARAEVERLRAENREVAQQIIDNDRAGVVKWATGLMTSLDDEMHVERLRGATTWQPIETAPREHGYSIMVSWPVRELDDDDMPTGPILRRVTLITEMNGNQWLDPDVCNASGSWFGDDYAFAEQPDLWMPLPTAPAA